MGNFVFIAFKSPLITNPNSLGIDRNGLARGLEANPAFPDYDHDHRDEDGHDDLDDQDDQI